MEPNNTQQNQGVVKPKQSGLIMGILAVSLLLIIGIVSAAFYLDNVKTREIKDLNTKIDQLEQDLDSAKKAEVTPITAQVTLKTYTDNDLKISFTYEENMTVVPGSFTPSTTGNPTYTPASKKITITDVNGNSLVLNYLAPRIECDDPSTTHSVGRVREDAEWSAASAYVEDSKIYRYRDKYYTIENEKDSSEQVCLDANIGQGIVTKLTVNTRSRLGAFDNLIKSIKKI